MAILSNSVQVDANPEQSQPVNGWNATAVDYPLDHLLLHQLFEAQVERTPNQIALLYPATTAAARPISLLTNS